MIDRRLLVLVPLLAVLALPALAQKEPLDEEAIKILRDHGLEKSQVMDHLSWICDVYGPRLTGSPNLRNAAAWAVKTLEGWGLENAHIDSWGPFGDGWRLDRSSAQVIGDNPWPVLAWPKAWSPSLDGRVKGEVVFVGAMTAEQLAATNLEGKIVLLEAPREVSEPFEGPAKRFNAEDLLNMANGTRDSRGRPASRAGDSMNAFLRRGQLLEAVCAKKPLAILDRGSKGDYGSIFVSGASIPSTPGADRSSRPRPWMPGDTKVIPQFTVAVEHYNRMCRLLEKKVPVTLELELEATFFKDDPMQPNVIAEIPGKDPELGSEVVMIGAHFDSWHSATGATDNGCGSAVMMEAMRLLTKVVEAKGGPRRTIRIALWSGEEQGLLGSRAYVQKHFAESGGRNQPPASTTPAYDKFAGYFNLDNGTGRIRGVYLQGNEAVAPIFRQWLTPFHDLDATTITLNNTGGTDHQSFDGVGLPGFQFIQDPIAYNTQTHHSSMDNWDHAVADDLKQAATIIASFAWHAAKRDEMLPRKPLARQ